MSVMWVRRAKAAASLPTKSRSNNVKAQDANYANDAADRRKHQRRSGLAVVRSEHPTPERDCRDKPEKSAAPHCVRSLTLFGSSANRDNHVRYWGERGPAACGSDSLSISHRLCCRYDTDPARFDTSLHALCSNFGWSESGDRGCGCCIPHLDNPLFRSGVP